jgi:hypothetical protein
MLLLSQVVSLVVYGRFVSSEIDFFNRNRYNYVHVVNACISLFICDFFFFEFFFFEFFVTKIRNPKAVVAYYYRNVKKEKEKIFFFVVTYFIFFPGVHQYVHVFVSSYCY